MTAQLLQPVSLQTIQPDSVQVISICEVLAEQLGPNHWDYPYEAETKAMNDWATANNAHYYAKPRESFNTYRAMCEAAALGKPIVIVEDLS